MPWRAQFEWDRESARASLRRHGVDLADAALVFEDERALAMADRLAAVGERRLVTLGRDGLGRVLVVAYARRGDRVRLLSARKATPAELSRYRAPVER